MLLPTVRRLTALGVAALFSSPAVLPLVLCLCAPVASHHGCGAEPGGSPTISCCCEGDTAVPATPTTTAALDVSAGALVFLAAAPQSLDAAGHFASAFDTNASIVRTRPLFKRFSAFLI